MSVPDLNVVIPATFRDLTGPDQPIFDLMNINPGYAVECALAGWGWRYDERALYDLLAEDQLDRAALADSKVLPDTQQFDLYFQAMRRTMRRIEPYLLNVDNRPNAAVDFIRVEQVAGQLDRPFFIAKVMYET